MTKQDILNMKSSKEIMNTMFSNSDLWDEEVNEHLKKTKKAENKKEYGSEDFLPTPNKRKASDE